MGFEVEDVVKHKNFEIFLDYFSHHFCFCPLGRVIHYCYDVFPFASCFGEGLEISVRCMFNWSMLLELDTPFALCPSHFPSLLANESCVEELRIKILALNVVAAHFSIQLLQDTLTFFRLKTSKEGRIETL